MEKKTKIILIIVGATIFLALLGFWIYNRYFVEQMLEITSPKGGEVFQAGKTYQITWDARNIGNIGIMLVKGRDQKEIKVIASDIPASKRKFDYSVFVWENAGEDYDQDYKIAIYEYPWQEGKKISYSTDYFTIAGPKFASCDTLSKNNEWPYLPSDYPELKKVFVTQGSYNGNLEGLEGADRKCQDEAEKLDYGGTWKAFLGDDQKLATDRLNLEGIFIDAKAETSVVEGKTCHRLLGKDANSFLKLLTNSYVINLKILNNQYFDDMSNLWLGRISKESKRECTTLSLRYVPLNLSESYSFTTTCQNWTTESRNIPGYPPAVGQTTSYPECYTAQGKRLSAVGLGALASGVAGEDPSKRFVVTVGKSCDQPSKLLCIEQ